MARPPLARGAFFNATAAAAAATVLERPVVTSDLLMTSVPPTDDVLVAHVHGLFGGRIPLRTLQITSWPSSMPHLQCMHCGGQCDAGPPVPAARHYDSQQDQYWVYGPFCRPCCAFGYICEHDSTSKQLAATAEMLRRYFGLRNITVAPPRGAHKRFGGPLNDADFYGESGFVCLTTVQPPFVTYANYVVGVHQGAEGGGAALAATTAPIRALLPQSAGRLVGLTRPEERFQPMAEKKPTSRAPMILEFLASLSSTKNLPSHEEAIEVKASAKRRRIDAAPAAEQPNFLQRYVKKPTAGEPAV